MKNDKRILWIAICFLGLFGQSFSQCTSGNDTLFVSKIFTDKNGFTEGIEGPAVDKAGNLYVVNFQKQSTIGKVTPNGSTTIFVELPEGSVGNGIRFNRKGDMFIADYTAHNILKVDMETKDIEIYAHDDRMNQPNDLAIDDHGVLYASDPNWNEGTGKIWRIDTNGTIRLLNADMGTTNGIEISPDNGTLYVNESDQHKLWAFDLSLEGQISNKRLLREFDNIVLDGMRCDSMGNLYISCYNKGNITIVSPQGKIIRNVKLIGDTVSNLCFGGPDGRTCYVTMVDNRNIEVFRTDIPGRSWVMNHSLSGIEKNHSSIFNKDIKLDQNYPNPFNLRTFISYHLSVCRNIQLDIYNLEGQKITRLINGKQGPGKYRIEWDASSYPSGIYFYRMLAGGWSVTDKMQLIK